MPLDTPLAWFIVRNNSLYCQYNGLHICFPTGVARCFYREQYVTAQDKPFLSPARLKEEAGQYVFKLPSDSANVIYSVTYGTKNKAATVSYNHSEKGYTLLMLNPYSGEFIHEKTYKGDFFSFILAGHRNLWLPYAIGHQIVGWAVVIFVIVTLTGLVLWLPRKWKKKAIKAGMTIKRKSKSLMLFYQLHQTLGFYTLLFALILALTGLTWSFKWYAGTYYKVISGGRRSEAMGSGTVRHHIGCAFRKPPR